MRADTTEIAHIDARLKSKVGMSLEALYHKHKGKVADKWSAYLREYDRILTEYRHRPVRLLEIGVQNGGSLEVWADYFTHAKAIVGCDIAPECDALRYDDPRIAVIVGDANSDAAQRKILEHAPKLDIVIDDGSHRSGDIVQSFARYFPHVVDGGVFIIEDLHCSYWQEYEGGLFHPHSSMTFLKRLADVINHEHWGVARFRNDIVRGILQQYGLSMHEHELGRVHAIEFINSMCVIRKAPSDENVLGNRVIVGTEERVKCGIIALQGMARPEPDDQSKNGWSTAALPPEEELVQLRAAVAPLAAMTARVDRLQRELAAAQEELTSLRTHAEDREARAAELSRSLSVLQQEHQALVNERGRWHAALSDRDRKVASLASEFATMVNAQARDASAANRDREAQKQKIRRLESELANTQAQLKALQESPLWQITAPLRSVSEATAKLSPQGGYYRAFRRARKVLRQNGVRGATARMLDLMTGRAKLAPSPQVNAPSAAAKRKPEPGYAEWLRRFDTLTPETRQGLVVRAEAFAKRPLISIVMPTYNPKLEWLEEAVRSVQLQIYPYWELCIVDDASSDPRVRPFLEKLASEDPRIILSFREKNGHISRATNTGFETASGEWIALLDHDDILREQALFRVVEAINAKHDLRLIYSDEDKVRETGERHGPYFKPDWNPDLFLSHNMICHLGVYRADLIRDVGGCRPGFEGAQDYDLALRCTERLRPEEIHHIPRVLYSWRVHPQSTANGGDAKPYAVDAGKRALEEHFMRTNVKATVEIEPGVSYRVKYELPDVPPLVSLIIPTRNAEALVRQCIESIRSRTSYSNYEILLVDNGSDEPVARAYFAQLERDGIARVLRDDRPFNYSALNNAAVEVAQGELICLLNNDIEVLSEDWLTEMVSIALQPGVGAVGARLWYPDNRLQHGGVVLGVGGVAGHAHKGLPRGKRGHTSRAVLTQSFSAVTAACLLVSKRLYQHVGGLNERELQVAFNDVDFCLRIREAGYRNVWTPYAELYHHESATRGYEDTPEKAARFGRERRFMEARWGHLLLADPAYSPNLTLDRQDFSLAWPPRVPRL